MRRRRVLASAAVAGLLATATGLAAVTSTLAVGEIEDLGLPSGLDFAYGYGHAANSSGTVVGYAWLSYRGEGLPYGYRALRSLNGQAPEVLQLPSDAWYPTVSGYADALAYDVAETGLVAGYYVSWFEACSGCGYSSRLNAVVWDAQGNPTVLPAGHVRADGWSYSFARAISPNGQYVLGHTQFGDYESNYARWSTAGGGPVPLARPSIHWAEPLDVNDAGVVVGYRVSEEYDPYYGWYRYRAARWSADGQTVTDLQDLVPDGASAPLYHSSIAYAVLADGGAVGYQEIDADGTGPQPMRTYAVRWDASGAASDISPVDANGAVAYDANEAGVTAMFACMPSSGCHSAVAYEGNLQVATGGWLGTTGGALSEVSGGSAFLAGYTTTGIQRMARWSISIGAPNTAPVVSFASATVNTSEGVTVLLEPTVTDDSPGQLVYEWDITSDDADDFVSGAATHAFTPSDNGLFPVRVRVTDGEGAVSDVATVVVAAASVAPKAKFSASPISVPEGSSFTLELSSPSDPSPVDAAAGFSTAFDCGLGALGSFSALSTDAPFTATCATTDDGERKTVGAIRDKDGAGNKFGPIAVKVTNVAPKITQLELPAAPVAINTNVSATARFADPGTDDTHTAQFTWDWDLGANAAAATSATSLAEGASGAVTSGTSYGAAGVYTVHVVVKDDDGGFGTRVSNADVPAYVVVYDPSAGFVTGGGWIASPAGACRIASCTMETAGKATFGFVSRYRKGATTPDGNTEFEFAAGALRFKSSSYDWLVVSGARGQFKGEGTINGMEGYRFLLTAIDGQINGGGGTDRFRIKIWQINADGTDGNVVYDNQIGSPDDSHAATALGGGSIVIHSK